ncbi:MAG: DUF2520 domain-containing protein [Chitinophagales bacterium]
MSDIKNISRIACIGTGNVAWRLSEALQEVGMQIVAISGRDEQKAQELAVARQTNVYPFGAQLPPCDLVLFAVRDDAIASVAEKYAGTDAIGMHASGAVPSEVLRVYGERFGAVWPMQSISRTHKPDLSNAFIAITGSDTVTAASLATCFAQLSNRVRVLSDEQRLVMHMSAVWIQNFTNHMFDIAAQLMEERRLEFADFMPLIEEHVQKLHTHSPAALQTGPAKRGEMEVMRMHEKLLSEHPEWQRLYREISDSILKEFIKQ